MKIGFYSPYLDTFGGGERYILTLASHLSEKYDVDIFWDEPTIKAPIARFLKIDMARINFKENIFGKPIRTKLASTLKYDLIFVLSDGSVPLSLARKNILHFQVPFTKNPSLGSKIKLLRYKYVICNSYFTKFFIDKAYGISSKVIFPPVDVDSLKPLEKENLILSVGRIGSHQLHPKKHEVLIEVFKEVYKKAPNWRLVIAGQVKKEDYKYLRNLKKISRGFAIKILENISFEDLKQLYGNASIYWHATGFGEDEHKSPQKTEHFGISTVEASAAGALPVVIAMGGQKEIVNDGKNGFLWNTKTELLETTLNLINDPNKRKTVSTQAIRNSKRFGKDKFIKSYEEILF